jgi:hypothetical protein
MTAQALHGLPSLRLAVHFWFIGRSLVCVIDHEKARRCKRGAV